MFTLIRVKIYNETYVNFSSVICHLDFVSIHNELYHARKGKVRDWIGHDPLCQVQPIIVLILKRELCKTAKFTSGYSCRLCTKNSLKF